VEARILSILVRIDAIAMIANPSKTQEISTSSLHTREHAEQYMQLETDGQLKISTQHIIKEELNYENV
jgi:hypothetical protein